MSYNQSEKGQQVRVGNWFEELKLKEETGIRFAPNPTDRSTSLMTTGRCITHSEQTFAKDYKSVTQESISLPQSHPEYKWSKILGSGPRQKMLQQQLEMKVQNEFEATKLRETAAALVVDYTSETKRNFTIRGFTPLLTDKESFPLIQMPGIKFPKDSPISFYSDSIKRGDKLSFATTAVVTENPFRKNGSFSTVMSKHPFDRRGESNERPKPLPNVNQYNKVANFRINLIGHAKKFLGSEISPGKAVREIIRALWLNPENSGVAKIGVSKLADILHTYFSFPLNFDEMKALCAAFDAGVDDDILLIDLSNFLRRIGNPKRMDLIHSAFYVVTDDVLGGAWTTESQIREKYMLGDVDDFIANLNDIRGYAQTLGTAPKCRGQTPKNSAEFSINDFFDYYFDYSAEVDDDDDFENIVNSSWGL